MTFDDLIMTIDSDAEDVEVEAPKDVKPKKSKTSSKATEELGTDEKDTLNPEFTFNLTGDVYEDVLNGKDSIGDLIKGSKRVCIMLYTFMLSSSNHFGLIYFRNQYL